MKIENLKNFDQKLKVEPFLYGHVSSSVIELTLSNKLLTTRDNEKIDDIEDYREESLTEQQLTNYELKPDEFILTQIKKELPLLPFYSMYGHTYIFGTPTRYENMAGQMRQFLDTTGELWQKGALVGKVGSVFVSTATQHGGQESTILSFHTTLLHLGMIVVGLPYSFEGQMRLDEVTGGSPYGATTIAGGDGSRQPSDNELVRGST